MSTHTFSYGIASFIYFISVPILVANSSETSASAAKVGQDSTAARTCVNCNAAGLCTVCTDCEAK